MPISQIYLTETVLTDAQIKALPTTSITLVAAVADSVLYPLFAHARLNWVADYTNINAGSLLKILVSGSDLVWPLRESLASSVTALLAGGGPDGTHAFFSPRFKAGALLSDSFGSMANFYDSDVKGQALTLAVDNGVSGNFTGGNVGNSLTVQTGYMILPS